MKINKLNVGSKIKSSGTGGFKDFVTVFKYYSFQGFLAIK